MPTVLVGTGASGPLAECFGESRVEGRLCEAVPLFSHVSHLTCGYCSYFSSSPPLCAAMLASSPFLKLTPPQGLCTAVPLPEGPPPDSRGAHSPTFFRILTNVTFLARLSLTATSHTPSPSPDLFSPHGHLPTVCLSFLCNKCFRLDEGEGLGGVKARTRGTRGQWSQLGATVMVLGPS